MTSLAALNMPLEMIQDLFARIQRPQGPIANPPMTLPASNMVQSEVRISTKCPPLDTLLDGGLSRGHILELSGPPGCPKERIAVNVLKSFVEIEHEAIFLGEDVLDLANGTVSVISLF